jgi:hypothetical protein
MASTDSSDTDTIRSCQNDLPAKIRLVIHNQFPGIELVSPVYVSNNATDYLSSNQKVDVGATMQVDFNIASWKESVNAFIYKLQRKNIDQSNENNTSSEEEATCTQLVIMWTFNSYGMSCIHPFLIEHDEGRVWNVYDLVELTEDHKIFYTQYALTEDTWLMRDNSVLMTSLNETCEDGCYKLEMTISEASMKDDTQRIMYIDMDR